MRRGSSPPTARNTCCLIVNSKVPHHVACDLADAVAAARNPSEDDSKNVFVDLATALVSATLFGNSVRGPLV